MSKEKTYERRMKRDTERRGGQALKLAATGKRGDPDRLHVFPGQLAVFVEVKDDGVRPSKLQLSRLRRYQRMGFFTKVVNSEISYLELYNHIDQKLLIE